MKTKKLIFGALFSLIAVFAMTTSFERETISLESEIVEAIAGSGGGVTCCPDKGDTCVLSNGDTLKDQDEC